MDSGVVLRSARQRAHLTQQLAVAAGVTQSVVSAYESGRRQPSVPTLTALVAATGFELDLQLRTTPRRLAHRYFDTSHAIVQATIANDLPELRDAVTRLIDTPEDEERTGTTGSADERALRCTALGRPKCTTRTPNCTIQ